MLTEGGARPNSGEPKDSVAVRDYYSADTFTSTKESFLTLNRQTVWDVFKMHIQHLQTLGFTFPSEISAHVNSIDVEVYWVPWTIQKTTSQCNRDVT